jgi:hypothetical protein
MGLSTACVSCHEDIHRGQLDQSCERCHDTEDFKRTATSFDHTRARFQLTGRHREVKCADCHKPIESDAKTMRYKPIAFDKCGACHQDPHRGSFQAACDSCHDTASWKETRTRREFDHSRTKFPLVGKHAPVSCVKCHQGARFNAPLAHARCMDCHKDAHDGQFASRPDRGECAPCHNEQGFKPSTYGVPEHQSARFRLEGAHARVECAKCHPVTASKADFRPKFEACADCHKDPHKGQFTAGCNECHSVEAFRPSTFTATRHQSSAFPLREAHLAAACADCHMEGRYRFEPSGCDSCHTSAHESGIRTVTGGCDRCHTSSAWRNLRPFDHAPTGFALTGAHEKPACAACHKPAGKRIEFRAAPKKCVGCHEDIHRGQFDADCSSCHTSVEWKATLFDHSRTAFPLDGAHKDVPCRLCHARDTRDVVVYRGVPRECAVCHGR